MRLAFPGSMAWVTRTSIEPLEPVRQAIAAGGLSAEYTDCLARARAKAD